MSCTILLDFRARADTVLVDAPSSPSPSATAPCCSPRRAWSSTWRTPLPSPTAWHSLAVITGDNGTRIFVDGYSASPPPPTSAPVVRWRRAPRCGGSRSSRGAGREEILARAVTPVPLIEFAAAELDPYDVAEVAELTTGTIFLRFRVRGPGQHGTVLAASGDGEERLAVTIDAAGLHYRVLTRRGVWREFSLPGRFDDGEWIDLGITVGTGAVDLFHSGYLNAHLPGRAFFADTAGLDRIVVGRLWGEVRDAAIYPTPLNGAQLKRFSGVAPIHTRCLFDVGYEGAVSYRIPSLLTTTSGVVLAGADQRVTIPNDAPNDINLVLRRSLDGGATWEPMTTLVSSPGAAATDSALVQDRTTGRVLALYDHFPVGIGQPNAEPGLTGDTSHVRILHSDDDGATWSRPRDLNPQLKTGSMVFLGVSPGNGIQLRDGRLLVPVYYNTVADRDHFSSAVAYSDDGGDTWTLGGSPTGGVSTYESTVVERADGSLLLLMRNQAEEGCVAASTRTDRGETYGDIHFLADVPEIFSQPNAIRFHDRLVFNASQLLPYRGRGVLRMSLDDGATWPVARTFNPKHYVTSA